MSGGKQTHKPDWRELRKLGTVERGGSSRTKKKKKQKTGAETVIDPKDVPPMPNMIHQYYDATEAYILDAWLPMYPGGVMATRLRNGLAFRMKKGGPSPKKKMELGIIKSILGEVARRNSDRIELVKRARDGAMKVVAKKEPDEEEEAAGGDGENENEQQRQQ